MILMAVHLNDPKDIPGKVYLEFQTEHQCEQALQSMKYWLKFEQFKVIGKCQKQN